jgi:hypothetical protein
MAAVPQFFLTDQIPRISDRSFDPEATGLMCQAFDKACKELENTGESNSKVIVAWRIIDIAAHGERDPDKMCEAALISVGLKRNRLAI